MTTIEDSGFLSDEAEAEEGRKSFRAKYVSAFTLADRMNHIAVGKLRDARLGDCEDSKFILYLLSIRVIEAFEAIVLLSERGMVTSAKLIIRPQLEALFTLAAIDKDRSLVARYFDAQTHAQYQKLRSSKNWQAPKLKEIYENDQLEVKLREMEVARRTSRPETLKPYQWANLADMSDYYNVYYVEYASYTHSNRESLEENLEWSEDGSVDAAFGPSDKDIYETIRNATAFTLLATMHMCSAFKILVGNELEDIKETMSQCDAQYYAS